MFHAYKAAEKTLQDMCHVTVSVEYITGADMLYTDGDASASEAKIVFPGYTVYIQGSNLVAYPNIKELDAIVLAWMKTVGSGLPSHIPTVTL
jgi:hypothetical protein